MAKMQVNGSITRLDFSAQGGLTARRRPLAR
jgi:hypothetical protein